MDHAALTGLPLTSPTSGTNELGSQGESSGRSTPSSDSAPGKLFVGGLSWQTSQDKLREYFGQFGNVTDVLVMKDPITQVEEEFVSPVWCFLSRRHVRRGGGQVRGQQADIPPIFEASPNHPVVLATFSTIISSRLDHGSCRLSSLDRFLAL